MGLVMIEKHDKNPESPRAFRVLVTRRGFEPRTHCLKGKFFDKTGFLKPVLVHILIIVVIFKTFLC